MYGFNDITASILSNLVINITLDRFMSPCLEQISPEVVIT